MVDFHGSFVFPLILSLDIGFVTGVSEGEAAQYDFVLLHIFFARHKKSLVLPQRMVHGRAFCLFLWLLRLNPPWLICWETFLWTNSIILTTIDTIMCLTGKVTNQPNHTFSIFSSKFLNFKGIFLGLLYQCTINFDAENDGTKWIQIKVGKNDMTKVNHVPFLPIYDNPKSDCLAAK